MGTIEEAAERLDCNKTRAVLVFCDVIADVLDGVEDALEHPDLPPAVAEEMVEAVSTGHVDVHVSEPNASVTVD